MARRKAAVKRTVLPDPLYGSERLARFINVVMRQGKKSAAERIVYRALTRIVSHVSKKDKQSGTAKKGEASKQHKAFVAHSEALEAFEKALSNVAPLVEVKSRRVGGATYQVPDDVSPVRGEALSMRWLIDAAKQRGGGAMDERLAAEIIDAYEGRGAAIKKRDDVHKMAKANQAFAHYRW